MLLHGNLLLQRPATSGRPLKVPAQHSHHKDVEENRELARNVRELRH